MCNNTGSSIFS